MLQYGSNLITFEWEDSRRMRFFDMEIHEDERIKQGDKGEELIAIGSHKRIPLISIPLGGIVEYHLDIPKKSFLKFSLLTGSKIGEGNQFNIAVYGVNIPVSAESAFFVKTDVKLS